MSRTYTLPSIWDARKFALRYGLNSLGNDFYVNSEGKLVVFPTLPDDPPVFEPPDPLGPGLKDKLDAVKTLPELIKVLKEEL
jgi:hypothetical protein